jgi:hypothetical protein
MGAICIPALSELAGLAVSCVRCGIIAGLRFGYGFSVASSVSSVTNLAGGGAISETGSMHRPPLDTVKTSSMSRILVVSMALAWFYWATLQDLINVHLISA